MTTSRRAAAAGLAAVALRLVLSFEPTVSTFLVHTNDAATWGTVWLAMSVAAFLALGASAVGAVLATRALARPTTRPIVREHRRATRLALVATAGVSIAVALSTLPRIVAALVPD